MLGALTLILICQLCGELIVGALGLPIPGPVLGMLLLFIILLVKGDVPKPVAETAQGLLRSMSLLFVPAGTGVVVHFELLGQALLPLGLSLLISTLACIVVTALLMRWLARGQADG